MASSAKLRVSRMIEETGMNTPEFLESLRMAFRTLNRRGRYLDDGISVAVIIKTCTSG